jgi:hypothetical protein
MGTIESQAGTRKSQAEELAVVRRTLVAAVQGFRDAGERAGR